MHVGGAAVCRLARSSITESAFGQSVSRVKSKLQPNHNFPTNDAKLNPSDVAIQEVFQALDKDGDGNLDVNEFNDALKEMEIVLPVPVVNFLFNAIDENQNETVNYTEFIKFINDDKVLEFNAEYVAEFHTGGSIDQPLGLELIVETYSDKDHRAKRVEVANITNENTRNYVLPGSEVLKIDNKPVKNLTAVEIKQEIDSLSQKALPCKITFRKTAKADDSEKKIASKMLGLMMGDEDWLVLSRHVSKEKLKRHTNLKKLPPPLNVRTKHCPEGDPNENMWVWLHLTFEDDEFSTLSRAIVSTVMVLIFISTVAYVIATIPSLSGNPIFNIIEIVVSISFTIEYAVRIITSRNAWIFFVDYMSIVDFLAIIPWWIEISFGEAGGSMLRVIRVIRLARVFRLLKTPTLKSFLTIFQITFVKSSSSAGLLLTILTLSIVIFASLMFYCEQGNLDSVTGERVRSDGSVSPFISIPAGAWWCIVTMTTVGYGDMYPVETSGMLVAVVAMFIGLFVIALPVIIISGNFETTYEQFRRQKLRDMRAAQQLREGTFDLSVENFLDEVNSLINAASGIQDPNLDYTFFSEEDKSQFVAEQFDTRDKLINLLKCGRHAVHFLPQGIPEYKLFVLYEVFGKAYRADKEDHDKFAKVKKHLVAKIQMF